MDQDSKVKQTHSKKAGRPSKADCIAGPSAKERIIETALRLFYQHGIHTVGIDRIIEESQVAKMTFFKHFPTKRDLVIEFLKVRDDRYMQWFETTLNETSKDQKHRLKDCMKVIEIWFRDPQFRGCAFINTAVEVGPGEQIEKTLCLSHKNRLSDFLEVLATDAGYKQPKKLANQLLTIIDGATIRALIDGPDAGVQALKDCVSDLI